jgi:hypothetical protein
MRLVYPRDCRHRLAVLGDDQRLSRIEPRDYLPQVGLRIINIEDRHEYPFPPICRLKILLRTMTTEL